MLQDQLLRCQLNLPQGYISITCVVTACCELHAWDKGYASQKPAQQSHGNTLSVSNGTANLLACFSLRLELYQSHMISTRSQKRYAHSILIVTCLWLITPSEHPLLAQQLEQKVGKSCTNDYTHQCAHGYVICIWTTAWLVLESLVLPSTRVSDRVLVYKCLFLHTPSSCVQMLDHPCWTERDSLTCWCQCSFHIKQSWMCTGQTASQHYISAKQEIKVS